MHHRIPNNGTVDSRSSFYSEWNAQMGQVSQRYTFAPSDATPHNGGSLHRYNSHVTYADMVSATHAAFLPHCSSTQHLDRQYTEQPVGRDFPGQHLCDPCRAPRGLSPRS